MMKKITLLVLPALFVLFGKADAQMKLRAKTHSTFRTGGTYTEDSTHYYHSGTKGTGIPKFDIPEFELMEDSAYFYTYNTTSKVLELTGKTVSTYNASANTETKVTYTMSNGAWRNASRATVKYVSNKPDTVIYETWSTFGGNSSWRLSSAIAYTWSGNNVATAIRLSRTMATRTKPAAWRPDWRKSYTWNAANKMLDSIYATWNTTGSVFDNVQKRTITYDASNKRNTLEISSWSGSWTVGFRTTYQYDANARMILRNEELNSSGWKPNSRDTLMYNAANTSGLPDTVIRLVATPNLANVQKIGYGYLSNGLLSERTTYEWNGTTAFLQKSDYDSIDVWYWDFNVGVDDVESKTSLMEVYPNPATDVLHITLQGMDNKQVKFMIVNVEGRALRTWQTNVTNTGVNVSVGDYPSGVYFLQMSDGNKAVTKRFVIQR